MPDYIKIIIISVVSYFVGNINFAVILSRLKHGDIRQNGSGNPGTMNVIRSYGKIVGLFCLLLDVIKSAVPAFFFWWFYAGSPVALDNKLGLYISGLATVVGHIWPVFMKFRGGKGIACIIGVTLVSTPIITIIAFVIGLAFIIVFKIGAIGSFIIIFLPNLHEASVTGSSNPAVSALIFALVAVAFFAHRSNIARMFTGTENRTVLFKKKSKTS